MNVKFEKIKIPKFSCLKIPHVKLKFYVNNFKIRLLFINDDHRLREVRVVDNVRNKVINVLSNSEILK
jgi:hypothetical protein